MCNTTTTSPAPDDQPTAHCEGCGKAVPADELIVQQQVNHTYEETESFSFCAECAEADERAERDAYFPTTYY